MAALDQDRRRERAPSRGGFRRVSWAPAPATRLSLPIEERRAAKNRGARTARDHFLAQATRVFCASRSWREETSATRDRAGHQKQKTKRPRRGPGALVWAFPKSLSAFGRVRRPFSFCGC